MKKKYKYLLIFLIFCIITFMYSFYFFQVDNDEIWNYGFAHNIYTGLVPYRDFNMIIPPLFAFCALPFFLIFGDSLFSFHLFSSIVVGLSILFMYIKIDKKAFLVYPFILMGYLPSYNLFCVFLFSILILINDSKFKYKDILLGLVVGLSFLTKQTVGICLLIPCLFYSKNKLKSLISFLIPIFLFSIYLLINNAFFEFIDYCFLGMFSFVSDNGAITVNLLITLLLCIFIGYRLISSKFKSSHCFYAIMFQIMTLPMGDRLHFYMALSVLIYALLIEYNLNKLIYIYAFAFLYGTFLLTNFIRVINNTIEFNIYKDDGYYYGRNINTGVINYINVYENCLNYSKNIGYDYLFVFSKSAYFLKLSNSQQLNKFDLINNGNMGYKSYVGYIEDIESMCANSRCVFIVEQHSSEFLGQTNVNLLNYPDENFDLIYSYPPFNLYVNDNG